MSFSDHSKGLVYYDTALLAKVKDYDITVNGNHNDVMTLAGGLVGKANGAPTADISLTLVVPKAGYEARFDTEAVKGNIHTVSLQGGGVVLGFEGWFQTVNFSGSTDAAMSYKATFRGTPIDESAD